MWGGFCRCPVREKCRRGEEGVKVFFLSLRPARGEGGGHAPGRPFTQLSERSFLWLSRPKPGAFYNLQCLNKNNGLNEILIWVAVDVAAAAAIFFPFRLLVLVFLPLPSPSLHFLSPSLSLSLVFAASTTIHYGP